MKIQNLLPANEKKWRSKDLKSQPKGIIPERHTSPKRAKALFQRWDNLNILDVTMATVLSMKWGGEETQGVVGREVDHEVADVETTGARFRRRRRLKCKREVHMQRSR